MAYHIIDELIRLNGENKTIKEIAEIEGFSISYVSQLLLKDKRYRPGKKGFARLNKEQRRFVGSLGGKESQRKGVGHVWDQREAREAAHKRNHLRTQQK